MVYGLALIAFGVATIVFRHQIHDLQERFFGAIRWPYQRPSGLGAGLVSFAGSAAVIVVGATIVVAGL